MEKVIGFAMIICRVSGFFVSAPVFGFTAIPLMIRAAAALVLSVFFASLMQVPEGIASLGLLQLVMILSGQAMYGLLLGLIVHMVFSAVRCSGEMIEQQMGLMTAETIDPMTDQAEQPLAILLETIFLLLLLASGGHLLLIKALLQSYRTFDISHVPTVATMTLAAVKAGSSLLTIGLRVAAPILVAFLLLYVVLAIFARVVPEMDILLLTFPARIGLGLIMTVLLIPLLQELAGEFGRYLASLLPV
ncbi:MAG: flagellar biosynthetic protein FliR [Sedimentisphaerales bacterium]|jgi:flagellar biosynthetic protein FliR|nr:flagellar biosynthetic protein FliR [Sedimentisphaerales bacterium]